MPPPPTFTGPYAGEFREAWLDPTNPPFVRTVLADNRITDQEWAQVVQRIGACYKANGFRFTGYHPNGGYGVAPGGPYSGEKLEVLALKCEKSSGDQVITTLRHSIATNPNNEPIEDIMTECLIRLHVVAPNYTPDDYLRDQMPDSIPYLDKKTGEARFRECNDNPSTGLVTK